MLPDHMFVSSCDGALHDTRKANWAKTPLRQNYRRTFMDIRTVQEFKATIRNGRFVWPGGYLMYLICSDGAALCFDCGHKQAKEIIAAIKYRDESGWRVVACDINYEDSELQCDHCNKAIESAYGD